MVIAVHGGAGNRPPDRPVDVDGSRADLAAAVDAGWAVLDGGGSALDAAQAAVVWLEDCPRYNAGRGAVLNARGEPELDAAVMDGATRRAGAVAAVACVRHPVQAARAVLERSEHVLVVGVGAEAIAQEAGAAMVDPAHHVVEKPAPPLGTVGAVARLRRQPRRRRRPAAPATRAGPRRRHAAGRGRHVRRRRCAISATGARRGHHPRRRRTT
jgi:beta-aspartyl-peptidase (threonine type)